MCTVFLCFYSLHSNVSPVSLLLLLVKASLDGRLSRYQYLFSTSVLRSPSSSVFIIISVQALTTAKAEWRPSLVCSQQQLRVRALCPCGGDRPDPAEPASALASPPKLWIDRNIHQSIIVYLAFTPSLTHHSLPFFLLSHLIPPHSIAIMSVRTVETKPFQDQKPGT